ncbi:MAG: aminotransferase class V-fold PLP-dependent enzyme [Planctomycetota bacterium]
MDRRQFLAGLGVAPVLETALAATDALDAADRRGLAPEDDARDESLWLTVAQAYAPDRSLLNLNNGGCSPTPTAALAALKRHLDFSNKAPPYAMWKELEPHKELVRQQLARIAGADPESIAIVRNTTEGLHVCECGFDLARGDEVVISSQDYPRMRWAFRQRERREGIVVREIALPVPSEDDEEIVRRYAAAITGKTKLILMCHVINLTGQILPVQRVVAMARERGIPVIVDGAHSFANLDFALPHLDCDYYATSLHKWLSAPVGSGMLFVKRERIEKLWPLHPSDAAIDSDIRKFEQLGTHPIATFLAIAEAAALHEAIGIGRKVARLRFLRDTWAKRVLATGRVTLRTSLLPDQSVGLATMAVDGIEAKALAEHLWTKLKILVAPIGHPEVQGIRVSAHVYTSLDDLDRFCSAIEQVAKHGLPG